MAHFSRRHRGPKPPPGKEIDRSLALGVLEEQLTAARTSGGLFAVKGVLHKMLQFLQQYKSSVPEGEDRKRLVEAEICLVTFAQQRDSEGSDKVRWLHRAADVVLPSVCEGTVCVGYGLDSIACIDRRKTMTPLQERMCVSRLESLVEACKIEGGIAARAIDYERAAKRRRAACKIHASLAAMDPSPERATSQAYLDYWWHITDCYRSLSNGRFKEAREALLHAAFTGAQLNESTCFPNYFRDMADLDTFRFYIDAVESVSKGQFAEGNASFKRWMELNGEYSGSFRFQNIRVFAMVCGLLERLLAGKECYAQWEELRECAARSYLGKATKSLLEKMDWIRSLAARGERTRARFEGDLGEEIRITSRQWKLFVLDHELRGEDRVDSVSGDINLPSFLDVSALTSVAPILMPQVLRTILRNYLLLGIDYYGAFNPAVRTPTAGAPYEAVSADRRPLSELVDLFDDALGTQWSAFPTERVHAFERELGKGDIPESMHELEQIFRKGPPLPHCVQVLSAEAPAGRTYLRAKGKAEGPIHLVLKRLWNRVPSQLHVKSTNSLTPLHFYYLSPRWNGRLGDNYAMRNEVVTESKLPKWLAAYTEGLKATDQKSRNFCEWICQFEPTEMVMATKLFSRLRFIDEDKERALWRNVLRKLPKGVLEEQDVLVVGIGHGAKSGRLKPYTFRQAVSSLPIEEQPSWNQREAFVDLAGVEVPPKVVLLLDDFIGTGQQGGRLLRENYERYPWLNESVVYFCALNGFTTAVNQLVSTAGVPIANVIVAESLGESHRAFSPSNGLWASPEEARSAEQWAATLGEELLASGNYAGDPSRDSLGWKNSQALLAFNYNVPNNTLPIFWARKGTRNGKNWVHLLERFE